MLLFFFSPSFSREDYFVLFYLVIFLKGFNLNLRYISSSNAVYFEFKKNQVSSPDFDGMQCIIFMNKSAFCLLKSFLWKFLYDYFLGFIYFIAFEILNIFIDLSCDLEKYVHFESFLLIFWLAELNKGRMKECNISIHNFVMCSFILNLIFRFLTLLLVERFYCFFSPKIAIYNDFWS